MQRGKKLGNSGAGSTAYKEKTIEVLTVYIYISYVFGWSTIPTPMAVPSINITKATVSPLALGIPACFAHSSVTVWLHQEWSGCDYGKDGRDFEVSISSSKAKVSSMQLVLVRAFLVAVGAHGSAVSTSLVLRCQLVVSFSLLHISLLIAHLTSQSSLSSVRVASWQMERVRTISYWTISGAAPRRAGRKDRMCFHQGDHAGMIERREISLTGWINKAISVNKPSKTCLLRKEQMEQLEKAYFWPHFYSTVWR